MLLAIRQIALALTDSLLTILMQPSHDVARRGERNYLYSSLMGGELTNCALSLDGAKCILWGELLPSPSSIIR